MSTTGKRRVPRRIVILYRGLRPAENTPYAA